MANNMKKSNTPKMTKEEFEAQREKMKEDARVLIDANGSYGQMDRIYGFMLLDLVSSALIFAPKKDPRARIGAIVINNELFMAGPTTCRTAGEYIVECFQDLQEKLYPTSDTTDQEQQSAAEEEKKEAPEQPKAKKNKAVKKAETQEEKKEPLSTSIGDSLSPEDMKKLQDMAASNTQTQVDAAETSVATATAGVSAPVVNQETVASTAQAAHVVPNPNGGFDIVSDSHVNIPQFNPNPEVLKQQAEQMSVTGYASVQGEQAIPAQATEVSNITDYATTAVADGVASSVPEAAQEQIPNPDGTGTIPVVE